MILSGLSFGTPIISAITKTNVINSDKVTNGTTHLFLTLSSTKSTIYGILSFSTRYSGIYFLIEGWILLDFVYIDLLKKSSSGNSEDLQSHFSLSA